MLFVIWDSTVGALHCNALYVYCEISCIKDPVLKRVQDYKDLKSFLYKVRDDNAGNQSSRQSFANSRIFRNNK